MKSIVQREQNPHLQVLAKHSLAVDVKYQIKVFLNTSDHKEDGKSDRLQHS